MVAAGDILGIAPQFLVDDLDRAIVYYRDRLGFEVDFIYDSFYASVSRDGSAIHLKDAKKVAAERANRKENEHLDAHIAVTDARALHAELVSRGAVVSQPLKEQSWSCIDFVVEDPDGYILCFSQRIS
jgi:uncharacterized glyoxalase superfamily protein PhnB